MISISKLVSFCAVAALMGGCGYPQGLVYTGVTQPHAATRAEVTGAGKTGDKHAEACATGILGLAAWGDASTDAAKKAGSISEVHSVEFRGMSILGIYTQGCTEVHGK